MISFYFFIYLFTTTSTREFELSENRGIKSISCLENKSQYIYKTTDWRSTRANNNGYDDDDDDKISTNQ